MGYYGRSAYRGDFMRRTHGRNFHPVMLNQGDWLDDIGGALGTVGSYIDKGMKYVPAIGKIVGAADNVFRSNLPQLAPHPALGAPSVGGGGLTRVLPQLPNLRGTTIQMVKQRGHKGGTPNNTPAQRREDLNDGGVRRRMNACNPKALRRALRRTDAFMNFAKKYVKIVKPGHHVELKARHHHKHKK